MLRNLVLIHFELVRTTSVSGVWFFNLNLSPARNLHGDATDVSRVGLQRQENGYHSN
jgi:hypothetical protein